MRPSWESHAPHVEMPGPGMNTSQLELVGRRGSWTKLPRRGSTWLGAVQNRVDEVWLRMLPTPLTKKSIAPCRNQGRRCYQLTV